MIHPCPSKSLCVDPNFPLANLTSEGPDLDLFLSAFFGSNAQNNPNLGSCSTNPSDPQFCHSNNPLAASLCANNQYYAQYVADWNLQCQQTPQPTPTPPSPQPPGLPYVPPVVPPTTHPSAPQTIYNQQVGCSYTCPDGLNFVWTVLPGFVSGKDQASADATARQIACQKANANYICITGTLPDGQQNLLYLGDLDFVSKNYPISASIVAGSIPPGLGITQDPRGTSMTFSGTPTASGSYTFVVQGTDKNGHFMTKQYTVYIAPAPSSPDCATLFANPSWYLLQGSPPPGTFGSATGSGPNFSVFSNQAASAGYGPSVSAAFQPLLPYPWTTPLNCTLHLDTAGGSGAYAGNFTLQYRSGGTNYTLLAQSSFSTGLTPGDYSFTIPGNADFLNFQVAATGGNGSGSTGNVSISGWFAVMNCASIWQRVGNSSGTGGGDTHWEGIISPTTGGHGAIASANQAGIQLNAYGDASLGGTGTVQFGYGTPALPVTLNSPLTCKLNVSITQNIAPASLTGTIIANLVGGGTSTVFSGTLVNGDNLFTIPANVATLTVSCVATAGLNGHMNMHGTFGNYP